MLHTTDISVIICTHSEARWPYLVEAVRSVQCQQKTPLETILVIDHNPPLLERVRCGLPSTRAVENREEKGAAGAKNSGGATARGSIVAFLDDDAVASPGWLAQLAAGFDDTNIAGVGGRTLPKWEQDQPGWFPQEFFWVLGCTHRGMPEKASPVRNLIACNMAVRHEVFEAAGGFRRGIGPQGGLALGCEETEFCIRVSQRWPEKIWLYNPRARVYHQVPPGRATWRYFMRRCYGEGRSKALVTRLAGVNRGLSCERTHMFKTLPGGIGCGLADAFLRGDLGGLSRAAAILAGLAITIYGYLAGTFIAHEIWPDRTNRKACRISRKIAGDRS